MALTHRAFASYEEYVRLQGGKARRQRTALLAGLPQSIKRFEQIFRAARVFLHPGPVRCLGARTGAEAIAAVKIGFAGSVGIDLHPVGPGVVQADWHALPFPDASFANVFTNSLDHCLYLDKVTAEISRVLQPAGVLYLMASDKGRKTEATAAAWAVAAGNEALYWRHSDELCEAVMGYGFELVTAWRTGSWGAYILRPRR